MKLARVGRPSMLVCDKRRDFVLAGFRWEDGLLLLLFVAIHGGREPVYTVQGWMDGWMCIYKQE